MRDVPIADDLVRVLLPLVEGKGVSDGGKVAHPRRIGWVISMDDWVFQTSRGTPYPAATSNAEVRRAARHLGMPWIFHDSKHSNAS